jgi:hypothetical protein
MSRGLRKLEGPWAGEPRPAAMRGGFSVTAGIPGMIGGAHTPQPTAPPEAMTGDVTTTMDPRKSYQEVPGGRLGKMRNFCGFWTAHLPYEIRGAVPSVSGCVGAPGGEGLRRLYVGVPVPARLGVSTLATRAVCAADW